MAMRKTIERSITVSHIHFVQVLVKDGKVETSPTSEITLTGKVTKEKALKFLNETLGKANQFVITSIDESEERYEISVEDFMLHATKVNNTPPADETPNPAPAE